MYTVFAFIFMRSDSLHVCMRAKLLMMLTFSSITNVAKSNGEVYNHKILKVSIRFLNNAVVIIND